MNRSPSPRPVLVPGLSRAWRGPHTLQLGLDPGRAVLIDLPDPRAARILDLLDGTRPERAVVTRATEQGVATSDVRELLDALRATGLMLPAPSLFPSVLAADARARLAGEAAALALGDPAGRSPLGTRSTGPAPADVLRRRAAARVVVTGRGRLGAGIAVALAESGVRQVCADQAGVVTATELAGSPLRAGDVGRPRAEAIADAVRQAVPDARTHPVRRTDASLIVQLAYDQPTSLLATGYAQRRLPHLPVAVRDGAVVVGPLVPRAGRPCLNCVDLHRTERDPGRPPAPVPADRSGPEPCAVATLLAATAYATGEVLAFLDGRTPETLGAEVEITAPGRFRRRTWPAHPGCGCARGPQEPSGLLPRHRAKRVDSGG